MVQGLTLSERRVWAHIPRTGGEGGLFFYLGRRQLEGREISVRVMLLGRLGAFGPQQVLLVEILASRLVPLRQLARRLRGWLFPLLVLFLVSRRSGILRFGGLFATRHEAEQAFPLVGIRLEVPQHRLLIDIEVFLHWTRLLCFLGWRPLSGVLGNFVYDVRPVNIAS